jgi:hypothetical protein
MPYMHGRWLAGERLASASISSRHRIALMNPAAMHAPTTRSNTQRKNKENPAASGEVVHFHTYDTLAVPSLVNQTTDAASWAEWMVMNRVPIPGHTSISVPGPKTLI